MRRLRLSFSDDDLLAVDEIADDKATSIRQRIQWIIWVRWMVLGLMLLFIIFAAKEGLILAEQKFLPEAVVKPEEVLERPDKVVGEMLLYFWSMTSETLRGNIHIQAVITIAGYVLNGLYVYLVRRVPPARLPLFVYWQLATDLLMYSATVYMTGGVTSPFAFVYVVPILAAGILDSARAALSVTFLSAIIYTSMISYPAQHLFGPLTIVSQIPAYQFLLVLTNNLLFFTIFIISTIFLRTIRRQDKDLAQKTREMGRRMRELYILQEVNQGGYHAKDRAHFMEILLSSLVDRLSLDRALLYLAENGADRLVLKKETRHARVISNGLEPAPQEIPMEEVRKRYTGENGGPQKHLSIESIDESDRKVGRVFAVPLFDTHENLIGLVRAERLEEKEPLHNDEARTLTVVADYTGHVLATRGWV